MEVPEVLEDYDWRVGRGNLKNCFSIHHLPSQESIGVDLEGWVVLVGEEALGGERE